MPHLSIRNFCGIKEAEIDIKPFTVFIGESSTGKSVVAKLHWLFTEALNEAFPYTAGVIGYRKLRDSAIESFIEDNILNVFFISSSSTEVSRVVYEYESGLFIEVVILGNVLRINKSKEFDEFENHLKLYYKKDDRGKFVPEMSLDISRRDLATINGGKLFNTVFAPAIRSFFALYRGFSNGLEKRSEHADYFISRYQILYDYALSLYRNEDNLKAIAHFVRKCESALGGHAEVDNDFKITLQMPNESRSVPLEYTSSRQQEIWPLIPLFCSGFSQRARKDEDFIQRHYSEITYDYYIVEEPEAHLYPNLQSSITELFLYVFNNVSSHFLLTTHSPYILAYLNVCLMRHQMKGIAPDLVEGKETLNVKDLAVYSFSSEKIESIVNLESGLINGERFDEATEKIDNEFDALLTRQYVLNNPES